MTNTLLVATRKGLFRIRRGDAGWAIANVAFLGDSVSMALRDPRDGAIYAGLYLGHFGVKLWRSDDDGKSWAELAAPAFPKQPDGQEDKLPDGRPWPWRVEQIWSLEPAAEPGALWCGTIGGGLFRSADRGASWELNRPLWDHPGRKRWFGGGADLPGIHSISLDDRGAILAGVSCGGAWRSTDGGASWEIRSKGMIAEYVPPELREDPGIQDAHRIVRCPSKPEVLWCQHHSGVYRSVDDGVSWQSIDAVPPSVFGFAVAVHPREPDVAWLVPAQKDEKRVPVEGKVVVARTRDGGKSWDVLRRGLPQEHAYDLVYRHSLDVDATGDRLAFGSTTGALWVTEDQGDSWQCVSTHLPPIYCVRFAN